MQITDEMVEAAWRRYQKSLKTDSSTGELSMRAALEAALGQFMLQYGDNVELQEAEQIGFNRSAACIENLAEALKSCEAWIDRWTIHIAYCNGGDKCTCGRTAILYEVCMALERWGLK